MPPRSDKVIPNVIIRPFVQEYLDKMEMGTVTADASDFLTKSQGVTYSKLGRLAFESGVSSRRLYDILHLDKNCLIDTADKLFCAMDKPFIWYIEPELKRYYYPGREVVLESAA